MRTEDSERIAATRRLDRGDVGVPRSPNLHDDLPVDALVSFSGANGAFQISVAYSAIVRSEENHPTLAVLRMLERIHLFWSRQASSIRICVSQ